MPIAGLKHTSLKLNPSINVINLNDPLTIDHFSIDLLGLQKAAAQSRTTTAHAHSPASGGLLRKAAQGAASNLGQVEGSQFVLLHDLQKNRGKNDFRTRQRLLRTMGFTHICQYRAVMLCLELKASSVSLSHE